MDNGIGGMDRRAGLGGYWVNGEPCGSVMDSGLLTLGVDKSILLGAGCIGLHGPLYLSYGAAMEWPLQGAPDAGAGAGADSTATLRGDGGSRGL